MNSFLLTGSVIVGGEDTAAAVTEAVTAVTNAAAAAGQQADGSMAGGGSGMLVWILYFAGMIALMYFIMYRPQKKREKELKEMQNTIKTGDWVMTSSGFYGKVADICEQEFVIEFGINKGVRIPVSKSEVIGNKEPNLKSESSAANNEESK